jgi:hypothetical protein
MNADQLNRLGTLVDLFEKCAKMGGTRPFEKIQPIVAKELGLLLEELEKEVEPDKPGPPLAEVEPIEERAHNPEVDRRV